MVRSVSQIGAELADREAIRDCLMRYARGIDRCDVDLLRTIYWPGATDEHIEFSGSAEEFIDYCIPLMQKMDQTVHLLGNILIDIEGATANVETYFQAFHRVHGGGDNRHDLVLGGRYVDKMERRQDQWKVASRVVLVDWFRAYEDSADWSKGLLGMTVVASGRHPNDRSYELLKS